MRTRQQSRQAQAQQRPPASAAATAAAAAAARDELFAEEWRDRDHFTCITWHESEYDLWATPEGQRIIDFTAHCFWDSVFEATAAAALAIAAVAPQKSTRERSVSPPTLRVGKDPHYDPVSGTLQKETTKRRRPTPQKLP